MDLLKVKQRFSAFTKNLTPADKIAIVYDSDADGFSAGILAAKGIEKLRGRRPDLCMVQEHKRSTISKQTIQKLKNSSITKIIFVDMAVEQDVDRLGEVTEFAEVVIFDHHKIYNTPDSERVLLLKSQFFSDIDGSKYPTAKLVYDIFADVIDMSDLDWISSVGIKGDMSYEQWKDFVDDAIEKNNLNIKDLESLVHIIGATITINRDEITELFEAFMQANTPKELQIEKFKRYLKEVEDELQRLLNEFDKKAEINEELGLIFYMVESKLGVKSALVNVLSSQRFPEKTIIIMQENDNGMVTLSARRQDFKIRMNDLLEMATEGLSNAKAGGHIPAAGGILKKEDLETFKRRIAEIIKNGKVDN